MLQYIPIEYIGLIYLPVHAYLYRKVFLAETGQYPNVAQENQQNERPQNQEIYPSSFIGNPFSNLKSIIMVLSCFFHTAVALEMMRVNSLGQSLLNLMELDKFLFSVGKYVQVQKAPFEYLIGDQLAIFLAILITLCLLKKKMPKQFLFFIVFILVMLKLGAIEEIKGDFASEGEATRQFAKMAKEKMDARISEVVQTIQTSIEKENSISEMAQPVQTAIETAEKSKEEQINEIKPIDEQTEMTENVSEEKPAEEGWVKVVGFLLDVFFDIILAMLR